jgi:peroxiredoxin Q/BCP
VVAALLNIVRGGEASPRVVLRVGDEAPDFVLAASDGRTYRLSECRERQMVVLAWFPRAFTGGCTVQCTSLGAHSSRLRETGIALFGANVDTTETNREFAQALGLDFPILSDPEKTTARAYGVLGASGFPARWTFYIGRDGRIQSIDTHVRVSSNGSDIAAALQAGM